MSNRLRLVLLMLAACVAPALAQEFRVLNPIVQPGARLALPAGAVEMKEPRQVDRQQLEAAVHSVAAAWNTPALETRLNEQFYDKSRLNDVLSTGVPRDARLRVLGVQGVQVLSQHRVADPSGVFDTYVSLVSATVRTQVEFTRTTDGALQRRDGTNEFILKVTQRVLR